MLIGLCGSICAGKHTVAEYLVQHHGFLRLHLPHQGRTVHQSSSPSSSSSPPEPDRPEPRLLPSVTDEKGTRGLTFPDVDALLEFVTKRWREHWVLTDIHDDKTLERLLVRPFFLFVGVDASISLRYRRFCERCIKRNLTPWSLEKFVQINDIHFYHLGPGGPDSSPTATLLTSTHLQILNNHTSVTGLTGFLDSLNLADPTRLRPTWDSYFMTLASLAARRSNCMKRRVGCVLISSNRIIATGYNGTPRHLRNCNEGGCGRCNGSPGSSAELSTCLCIHAEENALLEAGRGRIFESPSSSSNDREEEEKKGTILYCDTCPCLTCSVKIVQVGIAEVVYSQSYNMDEATARVFREAGVKLRQFSPPKGGVVLGGLGDFHAVYDEEEGDRAMVLSNGVGTV